jgi:hypothetical protein
VLRFGLQIAKLGEPFLLVVRLQIEKPGGPLVIFRVPNWRTWGIIHVILRILNFRSRGGRFFVFSCWVALCSIVPLASGSCLGPSAGQFACQFRGTIHRFACSPHLFVKRSWISVAI